jgi:hypothetical protein
MKYVLDIESNMLLADSLDYSSFPYKLNNKAKLWCICLFNIQTGEKKVAVKEECTKEWLRESLSDCTELIFHNGLKFDLIMLQLFGVLDYTVGYMNNPDTIFDKEVKLTDTLILSRLLYPDRFGGHSLESWGERLHFEKTDFRQVCIDKGYIVKSDPRGTEFQAYCPEMTEYCIQDILVTAKVYEELVKETGRWDWESAIIMENKLADKAVRRETLGFYFDRDKAIECLNDLNQKMSVIKKTVEPLLPPKPLNKGELAHYTFPARQISKKGEYSSFLIKFAQKHEAVLKDKTLIYKGKTYDLPYEGSLETHQPAEIDNLDHVKMYLLKIRALDEKYVHLYENVEWVNE